MEKMYESHFMHNGEMLEMFGSIMDGVELWAVASWNDYLSSIETSIAARLLIRQFTNTRNRRKTT